MELRLNLNDLHDIVLEYGSRDLESSAAYFHENKYDFDYDSAKGCFTEIVMEHMQITYGSSCFRKPAHLDFEFSGETVEMHFTLSGTSQIQINDYVKSHQMLGSGHNLFYGKDMKGKLIWESERMFIFEVNIKPQFFENYLPEHNTFEAFKKNIQNQRPSYLNPKNYAIQPKMQFVIQEIIHCNRKGLFKKMFIESKVMELLLLQLEQIQGQDSRSKDLVSSLEIERMQYAKELIKKNLAAPLSLQELSKQLNTNECSLKKCFKATFGQTVFGYVQELKMNEAKTLICDYKLPVYQVADRVGYKNPQHFTAAFKRHYGYVPSKLIR
jgi:AraC-like DNA-binding protein